MLIQTHERRVGAARFTWGSGWMCQNTRRGCENVLSSCQSRNAGENISVPVKWLANVLLLFFFFHHWAWNKRRRVLLQQSGSQRYMSEISPPPGARIHVNLTTIRPGTTRDSERGSKKQPEGEKQQTFTDSRFWNWNTDTWAKTAPSSCMNNFLRTNKKDQNQTLPDWSESCTQTLKRWNVTTTWLKPAHLLWNRSKLSLCSWKSVDLSLLSPLQPLCFVLIQVINS